jgi:hypothetical protein
MIMQKSYATIEVDGKRATLRHFSREWESDDADFRRMLNDRFVANVDMSDEFDPLTVVRLKMGANLPDRVRTVAEIVAGVLGGRVVEVSLEPGGKGAGDSGVLP